MKYKHANLYVMPFVTLRRLQLISAMTLGKFLTLYHKMKR